MSREKYPIIANGELYVELVYKKFSSGEKSYPRSYQEAKRRVLSDLNQIEEKIQSKSEVFLDEKVLCVRLEPSFEAKSYLPDSLILEKGMEFMGGRKYKLNQGETNGEDAKLYFIKTRNSGIKKLKETLENETKDGVKKWQKQIRSIKSIDFLMGEEKVQGFTEKWEEGGVEIVLHPLNGDFEKVIDLFSKTSGLSMDKLRIKEYDNGLIFISAFCDWDSIKKIEKFNPLRTVHPLGNIEVEPLRMMQEVEGFKPPKEKVVPDLKVGVFDGGVNDNHSLLKDFVKANDLVETQLSFPSLQHGSGVCGAILYGRLDEKDLNDELENPEIFVESFRVLPTNRKNLDVNNAEAVHGMYETIEQIEVTVNERKDIKLYNLSLGPKEPILDDSIGRFTYALDRLTYQVEEDEINPLFCVAVGNDGNKGEFLNRVQTPSDMINGFSVGAYTIDLLSNKVKSDYSSIGPGREGAKTKPDILEFGGCIRKPSIIIGNGDGMVGVNIGTSFATPIATGKIGKIMARSETITPHMGRALLIHHANLPTGIRDIECGYGFGIEDIDDILKCDDKKVSILYQGELPAGMTLKLPVYSPSIGGSHGKVKVTWTIATIVNPDITDTDAYTNNCIEDTFYPNSLRYNFSKKGEKTVKLNLAKSEDINRVKSLLTQGYVQSLLPVSGTPKRDKSENALRNNELKWDTVIKKEKTMFSKSLLSPFLTMHAMGRNGYEKEKIKYFVVVTVEAQGYQGSLYNNILQTYPELIPIEIHNINKVQVSTHKND